jgi:hypothetical protein
VNVPCNGCTLCCKNDAIRILPGDDPAMYVLEPHCYKSGHHMLAHKPNGDCYYLDTDGCSIHHYKPRQCVGMDCRALAKVLSKKEFVKRKVPLSIYAKGCQLSGRVW